MSWQEELRRLDVELIDGRITHERHRKLRDELLAGASGGAAPSPVASPLRRPDGHQEQSTDPSAPVIPPPPKPAPQFVTDRPTSAPSPADLRTTDSMPFPPSTEARVDASTAVRPAVLPPTPPPPPTPVIAVQPEPTRPMDDPFPSMMVKGTRPTRLFVAGGVLLVLVLIIAGGWWLSSGTDDSQGAAVSQPPPAAAAPPVPALPPAPALEGRVASPPGFPNKDNSTLSIARGLELGLYPKEAAQVFTEKGVSEVIYRASTDGPGPDAYFILVLPTKSAESAQAVVDYLGKGALSGGFTKTADRRLTVVGDKATRSMTGSWYASDRVAVTLWVSQPVDAEKAALTEKFSRMLSALQRNLPAG